MTKVVLAVLVAGFMYSGRATAIRYYAIVRQPVAATPWATIDLYLQPIDVGADQLRRAVTEAGWTPEDDVLVLAAASAISPQNLTPVYYAASYLLYPSRVRLGAFCDAKASATQCQTLAAQTPQAAISKHHVRRVLLIGDDHPFPNAHAKRVNNTVTLVTLP